LSFSGETHGTASSVHLIKLEQEVTMLVSGKSLGLQSPGRAMTRFIEQPEGPGGPGRLIERRFGLWRWKTWARENLMASRVRSGWSLRLVAQALPRADRDERRPGRLQAVDALVDACKLN
jgi:hypothetical protein